MPVGNENIYTGFREDRFNPRNQYEVIRTEKFNQSLFTASARDWSPTQNFAL